MTMTVTGDQVVLTGVCDIDTAMPLRETLLALSQRKDLTVRLEEVASLDISVLQVLMAATRAGPSLMVTGQTQVVTHLLAELGLDDSALRVK